MVTTYETAMKSFNFQKWFSVYVMLTYILTSIDFIYFYHVHFEDWSIVERYPTYYRVQRAYTYFGLLNLIPLFIFSSIGLFKPTFRKSAMLGWASLLLYFLMYLMDRYNWQIFQFMGEHGL